MAANYALASAALASQGSLPILLSASITVSAVTSNEITVLRALAASVSASGSVTGDAKLDNASSASINVIATSDVAAPFILNPLSADVQATNVTSVAINVDSPLSSSLSISGSVTGDAKLDNNLAASIDATNVTSVAINVDRPLAATIDTSGSVTGDAKLDNNLAANETISGSVTGDAKLENSASASITVSVISDVAAPFIENHLSADVQATNVTSTLLNVDKVLSSSINVSANITGDIFVIYPTSADINVTGSLADANLFVANNISSNAQISVTTNLSETVQKDLESSVSTSSQTNAELSIIKNLSGSLLVDTEINVGIPLYCNLQISVNAYPLLNVDGNVTGSPGGPSVEGFTPLSAVRLIRQSETSDPATYTVTASFSEDSNIATEIIEVDLDDNPAGVISYSYIGNQATFNVLTPRAVYAESSTFVLSKEVVPIYNSSIDYNTKFSTKIKQSRIGNNFYSTKFFIPGNYLCSLKDDGYGNINLYEWIDTITPEYIRTVGTINYDTGAILIKDLTITAVQDSRMFFRVESLDALAPTKDYLNLKSSQLVQSSTVTFPTGETVEISSYEKQTDLVVLFAYIKARSYDISNPSITIETREATYKIIILPDYDLSKQKILQTLAAETN